jgi:hypothetical protein
MPKTVKLSNAVIISEEYSLRKNPPNSQQIDLLMPEDYAKLKSNSEYFWVKVDEIDPFVGIVMDQMEFPQPFSQGDKIYFNSNNVYDIRSREWKTNEGI